MNKRKGFTLIELLTVIAILAIILLIAAPTILNVLDKAKKNTFKNQVLLYVEGLKQQVSLSLVNQSDMNITLPSVGDSTLVNMSDIPMDQDAGINGSIRIENDNGKYKYILVDVSNDSYKVSKEVEANILTVNEIVKADGSSTPKPITYKAYNIGDSVTLKDNTTWYVIENSGTGSTTITLFASQNMKNDASGWTVTKDEYKIAFDEANARTTEKNSYCTNPSKGCNIYAANGSTVTEDSSIKKFIDSSVKTYINNSLTSNGGTNINSIRLISSSDICNIINASDSSNNCSTISNRDPLTDIYTNVPSWLYSTNYWTMTPDASSSYKVYDVDTGEISYDIAEDSDYDGARPVIVTNKSNIQ